MTGAGWATRRGLLGMTAASALPCRAVATARDGPADGVFDIRAYGAVGDGSTIDSPAVNRAIAAAAATGGGVVHVPPGVFACYSIRLRSHIVLSLAPGATLLAATPGGGMDERYDDPEPNPWLAYQDFGHSHWHNSLIWGDAVHDVAILGPGLIWGRGLVRGRYGDPGEPSGETPGYGNKAIGLKNCVNVTLSEFAIRAGGHFGILATGVDNLTIENLTIDTNRDGMNIDCCRNVRIAGCRVNSPTDDGICLKSTYALGEVRPTENVAISDCYVTGLYRVGTMLDGQFLRRPPRSEVPTGRIKMGTESVGGFRNITVTNCVFEGCRGLALESVDGGIVEDIAITGVTMRDIRNAPFFLRLGARLRAPAGRPVGRIRRIIISQLVCDAPANMMPAIVAGIPDHPIEDILLADIRLLQQGSGTADMVGDVPPEEEQDYPEPVNFGALPAAGLFVRHARNVEIRNLEIATQAPDARALVWLGNVDGAEIVGLRAPSPTKGPMLMLSDTRDLRVAASDGLADATLADVAHATLP